ncbi:MAG: hypothetical protein M1834_004398 [Cirrosporium novae-zelandiae]|nr:MAG: hypothetical protein M1834_004398 [Cirrosporium novae-zelandiae]
MRFDAENPNTSSNRTQPFSNGTSVSARSKSVLSNITNGHSQDGLNGSSASQQNNSKCISRHSVVSTYFGHDREEITRLIIQSLGDLGYSNAAEALTRESGYELESPSVACFRSSVLEGDWTEAESLLFGSRPPDIGDTSISNGYSNQSGGLMLAEGADRNEMLFWLRQQKFLELLEQRDVGSALMVLREELTPLRQDVGRLHALSSLVMSHSSDDLRAQANWDGAQGYSRQMLLSQLSRYISPSVMLPEHRLALLLDQVKQNQINQCLFHNTVVPPSLYSDHLCDKAQFPLNIGTEMSYHSDEVWYLDFSHDGTKLASTSKDSLLLVYETYNFDVLQRLRGHEQAATFLVWSPDDTKIISCSWDNTARIWDLATGQCILTIDHHSQPVTSAAWTPDGESFVTGSLDSQSQLCLWSLQGRLLHSWPGGYRVQDLRVSPDGRRLITISSEKRLYVYNLLTHEEEYDLAFPVNLTCINISMDSRYMLVNMANSQMQLLDIDKMEVERTFEGQKQGRFVIRSAFGGAGENFVISGSEDSRIYIWHRGNGSLVVSLDGHSPGCVNAVAWNPKDPRMFASAGDDGKVRIWTNRDGPVVKRKLNSNGISTL